MFWWIKQDLNLQFCRNSPILREGEVRRLGIFWWEILHSKWAIKESKMLNYLGFEVNEHVYMKRKIIGIFGRCDFRVPFPLSTQWIFASFDKCQTRHLQGCPAKAKEEMIKSVTVIRPIFRYWGSRVAWKRVIEREGDSSVKFDPIIHPIYVNFLLMKKLGRKLLIF